MAVFQGADAFRQLLCTPGWQKSKGLFTAAKSDHSRVLCCNAGSHLKVDVDPLSTELGHTSDNPKWTTPDEPYDQICDLCPTGYYSPALNINRNCTPAARDKFVPASGMNTPSNCSKNAFSNPPNSTLCEICPAGYKMNRGTTETTCVECGAGQYQEYIGQGKYYFSSGFFFLPKHQLPVSKQYTIAVF